MTLLLLLLLSPSMLVLACTLASCEPVKLLPPTVPASQATEAVVLLCRGTRDSCRETVAGERGLRVLRRGEHGLLVAGVVQ